MKTTKGELRLLEGLVLGLVGAVGGTAFAALLLALVPGEGLPVSDGILQFFLGGPRLVPRLEAGLGVTVVVMVMVEVLLASLWPAWRGSTVSPRVAMSRSDD